MNKNPIENLISILQKKFSVSMYQIERKTKLIVVLRWNWRVLISMVIFFNRLTIV